MSDPQKPREVNLECEHTAYYRAPVPNEGDTVFCQHCQEYREVQGGPGHATLIDDCWIKPATRSKGYVGHCTHEGCKYLVKNPVRNYVDIRARMHQHYMRVHTNYGATALETVPRPDYSGPAPF